MKKPGIREIKKNVTINGGTFEKLNIVYRGFDAYRVNGKVMSKTEIIERYRQGGL